MTDFVPVYLNLFIESIIIDSIYDRTNMFIDVSMTHSLFLSGTSERFQISNWSGFIYLITRTMIDPYLGGSNFSLCTNRGFLLFPIVIFIGRIKIQNVQLLLSFTIIYRGLQRKCLLINKSQTFRKLILTLVYKICFYIMIEEKIKFLIINWCIDFYSFSFINLCIIIFSFSLGGGIKRIFFGFSLGGGITSFFFTGDSKEWISQESGGYGSIDLVIIKIINIRSMFTSVFIGVRCVNVDILIIWTGSDTCIFISKINQRRIVSDVVIFTLRGHSEWREYTVHFSSISKELNTIDDSAGLTHQESLTNVDIFTVCWIVLNRTKYTLGPGSSSTVNYSHSVHYRRQLWTGADVRGCYPLFTRHTTNWFRVSEQQRAGMVGIYGYFYIVYRLLSQQSKFKIIFTVKLKSLSLTCIVISVLDFCIQQYCVGERVGVSAASCSLGFRVTVQSNCLRTTFDGYTIANEDEVYTTIKMVV